MKRLGVIGSFVWDVIHGRDPASPPVEEWGGITYALAALDAALPDDWQVVPLARVGEDLHAQAVAHLRTLRRIAPDAAPIAVPYRNNRVELRYHSAERRSEVLQGGVPPWPWQGLRPLLRDVDALLVNLISGFELDLETAQLIRRQFAGPVFVDLHSLTLAVQPDGLRTPRALPDAAQWMACADVLQMNEDECALLAPDPMALAATAMAQGVSALVVTLGARGAVYFTAPGFERLGDLARPGAGTSALGAIRTALVSAVPVDVKGRDLDPTGCGDVFGATLFARMLAGEAFPAALHWAVRAAARNAAYRGTRGLAHHLRGELVPPS